MSALDKKLYKDRALYEKPTTLAAFAIRPCVREPDSALYEFFCMLAFKGSGHWNRTMKERQGFHKSTK